MQQPLSIEITPGTSVSLPGPSGCDKTTTLRLIAGLEDATSGRILTGGRGCHAPVFNLPARDDSVPVLRGVSAYDGAGACGLRPVGQGDIQGRGARPGRGGAGLGLVGLKGFGARLPSELSGGQKQRVNVARAMVLEPEVLLLDEPLSNPEAKLRCHVREEIRHIQQRLDFMVVYVTHDQEEAMAVSDLITVMKNAEIAQEGSPFDQYDRPASAFIADFIGDANLIPVEVTKPGVAAEERLGRSAWPGSLAAEVSYAAWLGNSVQSTLATAAGPIFAISPSGPVPFRTGDSLHGSFEPAEARLVAKSSSPGF